MPTCASSMATLLGQKLGSMRSTDRDNNNSGLAWLAVSWLEGAEAICPNVRVLRSVLQFQL